MNSSLPLLLGALGLVGTGVAFAAFNAPAPVPFKNLTIQPAMDRGMDEHRGPRFSKEDRSAFFDARVAALQAGLTLSPDQQKLWPPLETALRDHRRAMQDYWDSKREQWENSRADRESAPGDAKEAGQPPLHDPVAILKDRAEFEIMRGQHLKAIADAASPLYASLNEDQKKRIPILLSFFHSSGHGPLPPHMAMEELARGGEQDHGRMHGWMRHHGHDEEENRGDGGPGDQPPPRPHPGPKQ